MHQNQAAEVKNNYAARLRELSNSLAEEGTLIQETHIPGDSTNENSFSALLGGDSDNYGRKINVAELLHFIADMMEV